MAQLRSTATCVWTTFPASLSSVSSQRTLRNARMHAAHRTARNATSLIQFTMFARSNRACRRGKSSVGSRKMSMSVSDRAATLAKSSMLTDRPQRKILLLSCATALRSGPGLESGLYGRLLYAIIWYFVICCMNSFSCYVFVDDWINPVSEERQVHCGFRENPSHLFELRRYTEQRWRFTFSAYSQSFSFICWSSE